MVELENWAVVVFFMSVRRRQRRIKSDRVLFIGDLQKELVGGWPVLSIEACWPKYQPSGHHHVYV